MAVAANARGAPLVRGAPLLSLSLPDEELVSFTLPVCVSDDDCDVRKSAPHVCDTLPCSAAAVASLTGSAGPSTCTSILLHGVQRNVLFVKSVCSKSMAIDVSLPPVKVWIVARDKV